MIDDNQPRPETQIHLVEHSPALPLAFEAAGATDVGLIRSNNEDAFGYDEELGVFVLCDGMGGENAGEVASQLGVHGILAYFQKPAGQREHFADEYQSEVSAEANELGDALRVANLTIYKTAAARAEMRGMGTTVVAVRLAAGRAAIAHAGDSRIYRLREGSIEQLTNDHSLVMEQVRRGLLTREEAELSAHQNIITRAMGTSIQLKPDVADHELRAGDILLLCSDGLTRYLNDATILETVSRSTSLQSSAASLIAAANNGGGSDNITCVLIRIC